MKYSTRMPGETNSIKDVQGIQVGNYTDTEILSGTTVIIPEESTIAGVDIRGGAPGTRETALLDPINLIQKVDAITLSGGSAFGLSTASGVMKYLEEQGRGHETLKGDKIPIVPAAIIFDLYRGRKHGKLSSQAGYDACLNLGKNLQQGNYGAGTGAIGGRIKGGLGTASEVLENGIVVGALAVVNCAGYAADPIEGGFFARYLELDCEYKGLKKLHINATRIPMKKSSGNNTLLGVIATNLELSKTEATKVAQMTQDGIARAIRPAHTMYDGDTVFTLTTSKTKQDGPRGSVVSLIGSTAADVLSRSIIHAIIEAKTVYNIRCYRDIFKEKLL
jgi:L-aminopeptidase/D-esterase-like protein